jgi:hypothetical protein
MRNGQSTDTDINIQKKKTLEIEQSGIRNRCMSMLVSLDCPFLIVISLTSFAFCMSMSLSLDCPFLIVLSLTSFSCVYQCQCQEKNVRDVTIRIEKSRDTDIDIHNKKTLEIVES